MAQACRLHMKPPAILTRLQKLFEAVLSKSLVQKGEKLPNSISGPRTRKKKNKTKQKKHARTAPAKPESKSPLLVSGRTFKQQIKGNIFEMNSIWL